MTSNVRFQFRRDTTANLASAVLAVGEPVYDITTGGLFVGDGTNAVGSLPTLGGGVGATGATGVTGINEVYGTWDIATPYSPRDVAVSTEAPFDTYIAKNIVTGGTDPSLNTTDWVLLVRSGVTGVTGITGATGIHAIRGTFDTSGASNYEGSDVVISTVSPYNTYISLNYVGGPTTDPSADPTNWALLVQAGVTGVTGATGLGVFYDVWDGTNLSYNAGDVVINTTVDNNTYVCIDPISGNGANQTPDVDVAHWTLFVKAGATGAGVTGVTGVTGATGIHSFSDTWDGVLNSYVVGDVVVNAGVSPYDTYVCIQDIAAIDPAVSPDVDTTNWTLFVKAGAAGAPGVTGETGGFTFAGETYSVLWSPDGASVTGTTGFQYNTGVGVTLDILNIQTTDTGRRVAIGYGATTTGTNSVSIGDTTSAGSYSVSIGNCAGQNVQGSSAVAIGQDTGETNQGNSAVAIGQEAGQTGQGVSSIAVGQGAGKTNQSTYTVAVGSDAGSENQGGVTGFSVAIGKQSGQYNQGAYAVALGSNAGGTGQADNTIILNASGVETNGVEGQTGSFYVNPVRTVVVDATSEIATLLVTGNTYYQVFYSPATYEFIYVTQAAAI